MHFGPLSKKGHVLVKAKDGSRTAVERASRKKKRQRLSNEEGAKCFLSENYMI